MRVWSRLTDLEAEHGLTATRPLDLGLVGPVHRWAAGKGLAAVLSGTELAAGDFVRWAKQVIDLLDQVAQAAPSPQTRAVHGTPRRGPGAARRGGLQLAVVCASARAR